MLAQLAADAPGSEAQAVGLCKGLRREGKHEQALRLAQAGKGRSRALRLEEALAALGAGKLADVERVCEGDPVVRAALAPVTRALAGQAPGQAEASPLPAAVLAVAERVAALGRGEPVPKAAGALTAALGRAMGAIEALGALPSAAAVTRAQQALRGVQRPAVEDVWWRELAERQPERILEQAHRPEIQGLVRRALAALVRRSPPIEELGRMLAGVPREQLDVVWRPAAALLAGFALAASDPRASAKALDEAEQGGADRLEVLRGRWLATCGASHTKPSARKASEQGRALEALAEQASSEVSGAGLGALVWLLAAAAWTQAEATDKALRALGKARELAPALGQDQDELRRRAELLSLRLLASTDTPAALAKLDALLALQPKQLPLWRLRLDLTPDEHRDELLLRAAQATGDGQLLAQARPGLLRRRLVRPFEGLPAQVRAGQLAAELALTLLELDADEEQIGRLLPSVDALAARLGPDDRFALDVALLDALAGSKHIESWMTLAPRFAAHQASLERSRRLLTVVLEFAFVELGDALVAAHLERYPDGAELLAVLGAAVRQKNRAAAQRILDRHGALLSKTQLAQASALLKRRGRVARDPSFDLDATLRDVQERLAPHHALIHEMDEPLGDLGALAQMMLGASDEGDVLQTVFEVADVPQVLRVLLRPAYDRLSAAKRQQVDRRLTAILAEGPRTGLPKLQRLFEELITKPGKR